MAVLDTQTTDEEGKTSLSATLNSPGNRTLTVTENDTGVSTDVPVEVVNVSRIDVTISDDCIAEDVATTVTAKVYANDVPVPNILVHIGDEDYASDQNGESIHGDYVTNSDGEATHIHTGTGRGSTAVYAFCGSCMGTTPVIDTYQYFNQAERKDFKLNYYTQLGMTVTKKYNGLELASSYSQEGQIGFVYPNSLSENWRFEFDVVSVTKNTSIKVCGYTISYDTLKERPRIIISADVDTPMLLVKTYKDNVYSTRSSGGDLGNFSPKISFDGVNVTANVGRSIVIDNIRLYKW